MLLAITTVTDSIDLRSFPSFISRAQNCGFLLQTYIFQGGSQ